MPWMLTLLETLTSTPPPKPMANPVRVWESEKPMLDTMNSDREWATPINACADGVRRVWLRPLISGPAMKYKVLELTLKSSPVEVSPFGLRSMYREKSPLTPKYLLMFPVSEVW